MASQMNSTEPNNIKKASPNADWLFWLINIFCVVIISESVKRAALDVGEGCLSVDEDVPGFVPRANRITVRYQNEQGETKTLKLRDYPAIVFQHEIDHLHGHLYYDHINMTAPWEVNDDTKYVD